MVRRRCARPTGNEGATTITSANETSPADRDSAGPSKNRTIAGAVKALFKEAHAIFACITEDAPTPPRRRRGETDKSFGPAANIVRRVAEIPVCTATRLWLSETLDWLNLWQDNAESHYALDDDISAKQDQNFPQP
jgi:hypothetical protein